LAGPPVGTHDTPDHRPKETKVPTRDRAPLGAPTWIDLFTSDLGRAREFYGAVFGWTFESAGPDHGGYVIASKAGRHVAGLMQKDPGASAAGPEVAGSGAPDSWTTYFHTADIQATAAAVPSAGGTTCVEPLEVKDKGWMAIGTDPSGAFFGLWQPLEHQGFGVIGEAGAPVWHELTTHDFANAVSFYTQVLHWQTESVSDTDEFRYTTAVFDGEQELGVMDGSNFSPASGSCPHPEGIPSHWAFYLGAEDVDKTQQLVTDNGGTVLRPAQDTPYGRLAQVTDPTGAVFNLSSLR
jgi:predicted enzyme related to lactoylglutathione lyase